MALILVAFTAIFFTTLVVGVSIEHWPFMESFTQAGIAFGDLGVLLVMADFLADNPSTSPYVDFPIPGYLPNYPLIIPKFLAWVGLGIDDALVVGIFSGIVLWLALGLLIWSGLKGSSRGSLWTKSLILFMAAFSPPVMLLLERGNYDLLIFFLVVCACFLAARHKLLGIALITFAAFLKIFPIAAMLAFVKPGRLVYIAASISSFIIYLLVISDQLKSVNENTPRMGWASFGALVPSELAHEYIPSLNDLSVVLINIFLHAAGLGVGLFILARLKGEIPELQRRLRESALASNLFLAGTLIISFVYLLGNSYDYRLIFLLLPLTSLIAIGGLELELGRVVIFGIIFTLFWSLSSNQIQPFADAALIPLLAILLGLAWTIGRKDLEEAFYGLIARRRK